MPCQSGCCSQRCSVLSPASSVETLLAIASASSKPMKDSAINLTEPCSQPAATPGTESSAQRPARHPQARPGCHKSPPESRLLHHTESTAGSPQSGRHKTCTLSNTSPLPSAEQPSITTLQELQDARRLIGTFLGMMG